MKSAINLMAVLAIAAAAFLDVAGANVLETPGQGALTSVGSDGKPGAACPLEHTSVKASIAGFVATVEVTQTFRNPGTDKIEAVYTFPLSADVAVDDMVMRVGDKVVRGTIKRREEARQIYEKARDQGQVASLLDQERPNIFTQSVANIMPGAKVIITINYVEILSFEEGTFKFVFPMVVGPRFIPGAASGRQGTGWAQDTDRVPDASRVTPPVAPKGARAGHDIDLSLTIDAGVPIGSIESALHEVDAEKSGAKATVTLKNRREIPNRDFVLKYFVAGDEVRSGVLAHKDAGDGYVTVVMIPPKRLRPEQIAAKEMIFVIDCSGSQSGWPLEKAKETMKHFIASMNPDDTFNIIDFNVGSRSLFTEPVRNNADNRSKALAYLKSLQAKGGTWMGPAVEKVCKTSASENRLRIVTFMTDGYVGNDFEIISLVKQLRGKSRWFPFGTGNSVNRFLLDQMARAGGGEVEYVLLNTPAEAASRKFYERIAQPVLTDITIKAEGVELKEIYPKNFADLWSRKPLVFKARYSQGGKGRIIVKGLSAGKPYEQTLDVVLPEKETSNAALASVWARAKVDDLMDQDWMGLQKGGPSPALKDQIVEVALAHRLVTQYTSFVAVEETVVTVNGKLTTVAVPVEMPDGVSYEGVFGGEADAMKARPATNAPMSAARPSSKREIASSPKMMLEARPDAGALGRAKTPSEQKIAGKDLEKENEERFGKLREPRKTAPGADERADKLASELRKLLDMVWSHGPVSNYADGKLLVSHGKIEVRLELSAVSEAVIKKIEEAGLKITRKGEKETIVIGIIEVEKLEALTGISEVRSVAPAASHS